MRKGRSDRMRALMDACAAIVDECAPITVRGVAYKLFSQGLLPDMKPNSTKRVSQLLTAGREEGIIPWEGIVDDGRSVSRPSVYASPRRFAEIVKASWRADPWSEQPCRVEVVSEKATVHGVLGPVLDELAVPFRALKGFSSATAVYNLAAESNEGKPLVLLYLGDHDPSGKFMVEVDLPGRITRYGGDVWRLEQVAVMDDDLSDLPTFKAETKLEDTRYLWYADRYDSERCAELDALDPQVLRARVREAITRWILDPEAWGRVQATNDAVKASLAAVMDAWGAA